MASIWEQLSKGVADAVADIREKVVEEPMYGRTVTDREGTALQWPEAKQPQPGETFGSLTHEKDVTPDRDMER